MDGQISGTGRGHGGDLMELLGPSEDRQLKSEILPSYDFHPIRKSELGSSPPHRLLDGNHESTSEISHLGLRDYSSIERKESSMPSFERSRIPNETLQLAAIDSTVKKYADMLLHAVEGVSSRVSQLEGRTRKLEHTIDELKAAINNDTTDGKLKLLDDVLKEVKSGLQVILDKQEISEAQAKFSKLQSPGDDSLPLDKIAGPPRPQPPAQFSLPPQLPGQPSSTAQLPLPAPNAPLQTQVAHQNPPVQFSEAQPPQISYFPSAGQAPVDPPHQHYSLPPQPHQMPTQQYPPPPSQTYMPPESPPMPTQHYPPPSQQTHVPPELPPPMPSQHYLPPPQQTRIPPELPPPMPSQHYPPRPQQTPSLPPQLYPPRSHQAEEPPFPSAYGQTHPVNLPPQPLTRAGLSHQAYGPGPVPPGYEPAHSGLGSQQRLPTAQLLPQALPVAGGTSSDGGSTGKRVPVDDVVDKVAAMGFPRDVVRETVRRMTENGQSVDLNVVLDKLMNGEENQPRRGWFGP
ncbi:uncharacterized protein LOC144709275 [Wolffia australiana]